MSMSPLLPERKDNVSRENLLNVWTVLDWLVYNRWDDVERGLKKTNIPLEDFQEAMRNLAKETELWDAETAPLKPGELESKDDDDVEEAV